MTDTNVGLVPESTGPKVRVIRLNIGGVNVDAQVIVPAGADGSLANVVAGSMSVNDPKARVITNNVGGNNVDAHAVMIFDAIGSDGTLLNLESMAKVLNYNGDGTLNYTQVTDGVKSWRKTLTWTLSVYTGSTAWVLQ